MLTPDTSPHNATSSSQRPKEESTPPAKPPRHEPTPLTLPPILPVESPTLELPANFVSMFERGLTAMCTEHPGAGLRVLRYLPVSFATKQRIAEAVFADARLPNVLKFLPLLQLPASSNQRIMDAVVMRTICKPDGPTSFWQALSLKLSESPPQHERLALALHCVSYDVQKAVEQASQFKLETPEAQLLFTRRCAESLDVAAIRTLPWLPQLGREEPHGVAEIAAICISKSPLKTALHLEIFGLPLGPLTEQVLHHARGKARWKAIEAICANAATTDATRATLAMESFENFPHETLRRLESFRLTEGDTVRQILLQGIPILPGAVVSYLKDHATPLYREVAEQVLWSRIAVAPWDSFEIALKTDVRNQSLLSALIEDSFKRDATRALRCIDANKNISQATLSGLIERLACIDAPAVMRGLTRFEPITRASFIHLAVEFAKAAPEKAVDVFVDNRLKEPKLHLQLLLAMASTSRGVTAVLQNFRRAQLPQPEDRKVVALQCLTANPRITLPALGLFSLSERAHAEIALRCSNTSRKRLHEILHTLGVYSKEECRDLIPEDALKGAMPTNTIAPLEVVFSRARTHPGEVAATIRKYGLINENDRLSIALQCIPKAPKRVAENLLAFGLYSDSARKAVASAMAERAPERAPQILALCGVTTPTDVLDLLLPLATTKPRELLDISHLIEGTTSLPFFTKAFSECIAKERWAHTLTLSRVFAEISLSREPRQSEALAAFDTLTAEVKRSEALSEPITYTLSLIERVRRAGAVPERSILQAFSIFDEHGDAFIVEVLQKAGPTSGANIVEELSRIYKRKKTIPPEDQQVIREFIEAGFRGFSRTTLTAAKRAFATSPDEGRRLLESWKAISTNILRGKGLDSGLEEDPMYPNLVYAAYRPVDMSVADVRKHLSEVSDWTTHLSTFKYPDEGYPIKLVELDEVHLKGRETLNLEVLRATASLITDAFNTKQTCSHDEFIQILVRASQRGINSINKHKLTHFLAHNYPDPRLHAAARDLTALSSDTVSPRRAFESIAQMKEFFDVVHGDMLDAALRDYFEGGKLPLRDQFKARIRSILRIPTEQELSVSQIREVVRGEIDKVWRNERTLLNRESRKFTHQAGSMFADYRMYVTKSRASFFGRAGAGLCTADDTWSWDRSDFLQMVMVDDRKGRIVGNIQLHIFDAPDEKRSVLARVNPTEKFLLTVSGKTLAREMLRCVEAFAADNNLMPYLPHDGDHLHLLTNRESFAPFLKARYGEEFDHEVKVSSWLTVTSVYRLTPSSPSELK